MQEWWIKHLELLVKYGVTNDKIKEAVEKGNIKLRDKVKEFFQKCREKNIPIVVLSAGLGDVIVAILEKEVINSPIVLVVSNFFEFDDFGKVTGYSLPIIHSHNKKETELPKELLEQISNRKNVLLAGDAIADLGMIGGIENTNILSVGFLNENKNLETDFEKIFDVVLFPNNQDFSYLLNIVENI